MLPFSDTSLIRSASVLARNQTTAIPVDVRTLAAQEALVVAAQPLDGERMLLRLETCEQGEFLIECDVAHRSEYYRVGWSAGEDAYSACRLSFRKTLPVDQVHASLRAAFGIAEPSDSAEVEEANAYEEDSLVPVLSAIGIVVVYASQTPWGQIL